MTKRNVRRAPRVGASHGTITQYDSKFKAAALLFLESEGYPGDKSALRRVAGRLTMPEKTLQQWYEKSQDPEDPLTHFREITRKEMIYLVTNVQERLLMALLESLESDKVWSPRDIAIAFGILSDKALLMGGEPTQNVKLGILAQVSEAVAPWQISKPEPKAIEGDVSELPPLPPGLTKD